MQDFEAIYVEHFQGVYRFVLSLCRDPVLAEEIAQEAFFKAVRGIDRFQGGCTMRAYLCQIAKNTYFSHERKRKRIDPSPLEHLEGRSESAEAELLRVEQAKALHLALHALHEPYKEVFTLRVFAELSHQEIGRLFGKSESWARVTYHRAKMMLMDKVGRDEDGSGGV